LYLQLVKGGGRARLPSDAFGGQEEFYGMLQGRLQVGYVVFTLCPLRLQPAFCRRRRRPLVAAAVAAVAVQCQLHSAAVPKRTLNVVTGIFFAENQSS
jgi:hypothetical protein